MVNTSKRTVRLQVLLMLVGVALLGVVWFVMTGTKSGPPLHPTVGAFREANGPPADRSVDLSPTDGRAAIVSGADPVLPLEDVAQQTSQSPPPEVAPDEGPIENPFPYGRPPPDWIFEQRYAGLSDTDFATAKEEVSVAYTAASKLAFQECWDTGDFELLAPGQTPVPPFDDRIIGGRVLPGASDTQLVRLSVEKYSEVYQLFYEDLWFKASGWKP